MRAYPLGGLTFWAVFFISICSQSCLCSAWIRWLKILPSELRIHCKEGIERIIYAKGTNPIAFLVSQMNHFFVSLIVDVSHTLCSTYGLSKLRFGTGKSTCDLGTPSAALWEVIVSGDIALSCKGYLSYFKSMKRSWNSISEGQETYLTPVNTVCPVCTSLLLFS